MKVRDCVQRTIVNKVCKERFDNNMKLSGWPPKCSSPNGLEQMMNVKHQNFGDSLTKTSRIHGMYYPYSFACHVSLIFIQQIDKAKASPGR